MSSDGGRVPATADLAAGSITDLFHRLNRVLPENQQVLKAPGEMLASEALKLLRQHHYSQVPVVVAGEVLGLFSHRSFSDAILAATAKIRVPNAPAAPPANAPIKTGNRMPQPTAHR